MSADLFALAGIESTAPPPAKAEPPPMFRGSIYEEPPVLEPSAPPEGPAIFGIDLFGEPVKQSASGKLAERFIVPPFSVLDARQGYWQERKRAWLDLGIKSELGRGGGTGTWIETASGSPTDRQKAYKEREKLAPGGASLPAAKTVGGKTVRGDGHGRPLEMPGGGLTYTGAAASIDFYRVKEGEREESDISGTSVFDPVLCELVYEWFCPERGAVFDPFAGGSVRGIVAAKLGRAYVGFELREEQVKANREQAEKICGGGGVEWVAGDSAALLENAPPLGMADFIFSCPPYFDLEVYSDDPRDLSTMNWSNFCREYRNIIKRSVERLRENRFACFVVGDVRDKSGLYRGLAQETIAAFAAADAALYNDAILVTSVASLSMRAGKMFSASRKLGKGHQNVLVFVKGDWKKAVEALKAAE